MTHAEAEPALIALEHEVREALAGHLCRCTGYSTIIKAVQHVAGGEP